ncbi:ion channel [Erwiniaceae bacterium L1_55_4]|nr:ion channel [Erwiniaceae bacterium L1_55_4]
MPANSFFFHDNYDVYSQDDFFKKEINNSWTGINYKSNFFGSSVQKPLVLKDKVFVNVSFKSTDIKNVRFTNCNFDNCLFAGSRLSHCDFVDCKFINTNTHKIKLDRCLLNPSQFRMNFDLKNDCNIAIDLYQELYKNSKSEEQVEYSKESLYRMKVAEGCNLKYKLSVNKITCYNYFYKRLFNFIHRFSTGYGLKVSRISSTAMLTILVMALLNFYYKDDFYSSVTGIISFWDALYFTCVTVTTLGYGDIIPLTTTARIMMIFESLVGFVFMSLFVSAFINRVLRS